MPLPVESVIGELKEALQQGHVVLSSPPGSGKTTRVPLALLEEAWLAGNKILLLEPRRPAARLAARFMARLLGEPVGQTVGYQIRMERCLGLDTRIEVLTEGLLVRRLQSDPELNGVGLIIFDEFHERSLQADLGLALSLDVCSALRQDLRILVMSATLDVARVANLIGARAVSSEGGLYPVRIEHLRRSPGSEVLPATAGLVCQAVERCAGDILVFLPGKKEIRRLQQDLLLKLNDIDILVLHGEMDGQAQAAILEPPAKRQRRVILATDVAETSLTIDGISVVVDSGLTRKPRFDPNSGLNRLQTLPISKASAQQRAGRAGRLGPGWCYRAYTQAEYQARAEQQPAEILQTDLAPLVMELAQWGVHEPEDLTWLDSPPQAAWRQARSLLQQLGVLDAGGQLTPHGHQVAQFGLHPRLAHLLVCAGREHPQAADLAALLSEPDPWRRGAEAVADMDERLRALADFRAQRHMDEHLHPAMVRQVSRLARRLLAQSRHLPKQRSVLSPAQLLALAYPDRVALRRPGGESRYQLSSGRGAWLPTHDSLAQQPCLVVAQMDAGMREGRIWLALAIDLDDLQAVMHDQIEQRQQLLWDARGQRVLARSEQYLGALCLDSREIAVEDSQAAQALLLEKLAEAGLSVLNWTPAAKQLRARIEWMGELQPDSGWPQVDDIALVRALQDWTGGMRSFQELNKLDVSAILLSLLNWQQQQDLQQHLPERWRLADGGSAAIDYLQRPPVLAVPLQLMYGNTETPAVANGQLLLKLHLLSPAGRPLQVTTDLAHFWAHAWVDVKKEMRGRYPKHHWPDDPVTARPVLLKKNQ